MPRRVLVFLTIAVGAVPRAEADGMLDPSFGNGGIVITQFPGMFPNSAASSVVVLPDGRAAAAGAVTLPMSGTAMAAARYLVSGALDPSFSSDGTSQVDFPFFNSFAGADDVLLQPDGRLVLVGGVDSFQFGRFFALARLTVNGAPDFSFGTEGRLTTEFPGPAWAVAGLLQPDGRIIAVGNSGTDLAAARYNVNGTLDPTFGTAGQLTLPLPQPFTVGDAALQPDGKLVIVGAYGPGPFDFGLVRLLPSGAVDPSFDGDGVATTDFGADESTQSVIVLADGRLVIGGHRTTTVTDVALARYLADGTLDTTFGTGGLATADSGATEITEQLIELPNAKLVIGGWTNDANAEDFLLARFHPDGALDTSFGSSGFIRTDVGSPWNDRCRGVALAGQDLLLTAGLVSPGGAPDFALARYTATTPVELLHLEVE